MKKKLLSVLLAAVMAVGAVTLPAVAADIRYGDLNGDGDITPNDALLVLRAGVGLETYTGNLFTAADVDGDGVLTPIDALQILRYSVGLITSFPAQEASFHRVPQKELYGLKEPTGELAEILREINAERAKAGVAPVIYRSDLQEAADIRARELAEDYAHTRPDGRSCFTVFDDLGITTINGQSCENIAHGFPDVPSVMGGWMNSEGHRMNILGEDADGVIVGHYGSYWVQLFVHHRCIFEESNLILTEPPTCVNTGTGYLICTVADCPREQYWSSVPALGHDYQKQVIPATETEAGYDLYICARCGDRVIDEDSYVPAGTPCHEQGKPHQFPGLDQEGHCTVCGIDADDFAAYAWEICGFDHDYQKYTLAPTELAFGYDYYICTRCQSREVDYISIVPAEKSCEDRGYYHGSWWTRSTWTAEEGFQSITFCPTCGTHLK